jgi:hypothetical protein
MKPIRSGAPNAVGLAWETLTSWFGYGNILYPADVALAPYNGFTQNAVSLDPLTLHVTITLNWRAER